MKNDNQKEYDAQCDQLDTFGVAIFKEWLRETPYDWGYIEGLEMDLREEVQKRAAEFCPLVDEDSAAYIADRIWRGFIEDCEDAGRWPTSYDEPFDVFA